MRGLEGWGDTGRVALVPVNTATCKTTPTLVTTDAGGRRRERSKAARYRCAIKRRAPSAGLQACRLSTTCARATCTVSAAAVLCCAVLCCAVLCCAVLCCAVLCALEVIRLLCAAGAWKAGRCKGWWQSWRQGRRLAGMRAQGGLCSWCVTPSEGGWWPLGG
jgi:hypothetical protein